MKRFRSLSAVAFLAAAAVSFGQIQLNVSVQNASDGQNAVNVSPGDVIQYKIVGTLSPDTGHMGLALAGFNLSYSGGDLAQADEPATSPTPDGTCATAMGHFVKPFGITNPAGYGGTIIGGDLVQVGGGQNTIKNVDSADFPTGPVVTGVAQIGGCGPATLAAGSLTIPGDATDGQVFTLTASDIFANVIAPGQNGTEEFWATIAANAGTTTPLTMTVQTASNVSLVSSFPAGETRLWRSTKNRVRITFSGNITAPGSGEVQVRELLPAGAFGSDLSGSFTPTVNGSELVLADNGSTLQNKTWYRISQSGTWPGVDPFSLDFLVQAGDANNDGFTNFTDLSAINGSIPTLPPGLNEGNMRGDVNGDNFINFTDLSVANGFILSFPIPKPSGH